MPLLDKNRFSGFKLREITSGGVMDPEEQDRCHTFSRTALIVLCLFGVLFLRLWFLQLVQGDEMQERSEHNRIRLQDLPPWRGHDSGPQRPGAGGQPAQLRTGGGLEDVGDIPLLASRLGELLPLDPQQLTTQLQNAKKAGLHQARIRTELSFDEMAKVETFQPELPG